MPSWKKVVTSGSNALLNQITASAGISTSGDIDLSGGKLWVGGTNRRVILGPKSDNYEGNRIDVGAGIRLFASGDQHFKGQGVTTTVGRDVGGGVVSLPRHLSVTNNITGSGNLEIAGNISGSSTSTGSFGRVEVEQVNIGATGNNNYPLSVDGDVHVKSGEIRMNNGQAIRFQGGQALEGSTSTGIVELGQHSSFKTVDINNGILIVSSSGLISGSATSTGSFGRIQATTIAGNSPLNIESPTLVGDTTVQGNITATGDIIAENFIVSSSVTYMTQSFSSGSTIFGDSVDDTHQFTGSLQVGGSSFFREIGSGHQVYIDSDVGGVSQIGTNTYTPLSIRANGNQAIYISQGAQVTINNLIGTAAQMGTLTSTGNIVSTGANALISGSSTSTGSFGHGYIDNKLGINTTTPESALEVFKTDNFAPISFHDGYYGYSLGSGYMPSDVNPNSNGMSLYMASTQIYLDGIHNNTRFVFRAGGTEKFQITGNDVLFPLANQNISGSSTSTGSFGKLIVDDARFKDDIFIGSSGTSGFRDGSDTNISVYIANTARFKWYNNGGNIYFGSTNASGPNIYSAASSTTNATYRISGVTQYWLRWWESDKDKWYYKWN